MKSGQLGTVPGSSPAEAFLLYERPELLFDFCSVLLLSADLGWSPGLLTQSLD